MPSTLPRPSARNAGSQRPTNATPPVIANARPVATDAIASVAMSEGMRSAVTSRPLHEPATRPTAERGRDGQRRRDLVKIEAAHDHGAQAAHRGERQVELGDREGDGEADREDRQEAHLLQHVERLVGMVKFDAATRRTRTAQRGDGGAVGARRYAVAVCRLRAEREAPLP
jgi:hypothetical protein